MQKLIERRGLEKLKKIRDSKNFHEHRASDTGIFWLAILLLIFLAHYYLYKTVGTHLNGMLEGLWLVLGLLAMMSSAAARRLGAPKRKLRHMSLQAAIHRFGACWNTFVVIVTLFTILIRLFIEPTGPSFVAACAAALGVCLYGLYEAANVRVAAISMKSAKLPAGEKLKIVQISDLHISPFMTLRHVKRVVDKVVSERPDVVVVTGDLVDGVLSDGERVLPFYRAFARELKRLAPPKGAPLGVWAVPGNHDYYGGWAGTMQFMASAGIDLLASETVDLGPIVLVGADDLDHLRHDAPDGRSVSEHLVASLTQEDRQKFVVLLRHRPVVEASTVGQFDIQLSGHTHGGQLFALPSSRHRIPGRPRGCRPLSKGSYLYVSNGAGFVGPPMRFLAPAEIVVIRLEGEERS